jgi:hypothetical protein
MNSTRKGMGEISTSTSCHAIPKRNRPDNGWAPERYRRIVSCILALREPRVLWADILVTFCQSARKSCLLRLWHILACRIWRVVVMPLGRFPSKHTLDPGPRWAFCRLPLVIEWCKGCIGQPRLPY